jgi:predicted peroxiredoxin
MRGLTLILTTAGPGKLRAALTLAIAQAALGGRVRLFIDSQAVALLRLPLNDNDDPQHRAIGLPELAALAEEAWSFGVALHACQTGLTLGGLQADQCDARIIWGGLVGLLATLEDDRLVTL